MVETRAEKILGMAVRRGRWNAPVTILPEQAKLILEAMPPQRPVKQSHVNALIDQMKRGLWALTNETIAFDEDGLLFDGQHRMWACFLSATPIEVLCCFNEPRENFTKIGTVMSRRREGDVLVIEGVASSLRVGTTIANAARWIWSYERGRNPTLSRIEPGWGEAERAATMAAHPGIVDAAEEFRARPIRLLPMTPLVALATLFREADDAKAAIFLHQIASGEGLQAGDPALTLRNRAISGGAGLGIRTARRKPECELAYCMARAWNAFFEGRSIDRLFGSQAPHTERVRQGGLDPFPRIAGHKPSALTQLAKGAS